MAPPRMLVNLDAMITRADFAQASEADTSFEKVDKIPIRELSGIYGGILRKPDFQRETNHWTPDQVASLIECFVNGDLIPSVILWKSPIYWFVVDGGHRLSVLKAWVENDYGDGPISRAYFGDSISQAQKRAAQRTRDAVQERVGVYQHFETKVKSGEHDHQTASILTRTIGIQWVNGGADKVESSFFRINTKGTPLDTIEQALIQNRRKPIAISARAIIRAGQGHKYWSQFDKSASSTIETLAKKIHEVLFDPEVNHPIKTLDLPLGGSKGVRAALQVLIDYLRIACATQEKAEIKIQDAPNDDDGQATTQVLNSAWKLASRLTGNDKGSLGLHPAIYFYGPTGVHSASMFLGTAKFIGTKLIHNDKDFFKKFTLIRATLEDVLVQHKELIATILQKHGSQRRVTAFATLLDKLYKALVASEVVGESTLVEFAGLEGKIVVGTEKTRATDFSDETKSRIFIYATLKGAPRCALCGGYLDTTKSVSYDHVQEVRNKGTGDWRNGQITHPYCNQSRK